MAEPPAPNGAPLGAGPALDRDPGADAPGCSLVALASALVLLVLVGIVVFGLSTTPSFAEVRLFVVGALAGAVYAVGGVLVRRGRWWGDLVSLGAAVLLLVGAAIALAHPGARHPILMAAAVLLAFALGMEPVKRLHHRRPDRSTAPAAIGWAAVCVVAFLVGITDIPLTAIVVTAQADMDADAEAVLTAPPSDDLSGYFSCPSGSGRVGPFGHSCGRFDDEDGGWVIYDLYETPGVLDEGSASLVFAPDGLPQDFRCSNHLVGGWYELYDAREVDGCPWWSG